MAFRILQIIPGLNKGGAERLVLDICHELQRSSGIEVKLVTLSPHNEYEALSKGIDHIVINSKVQLSVLKPNIVDVLDLQRIIDEYRPDVIHSHLFAAEIVSRSCYCPTAKWFSHGHDNMKQLQNFSLRILSDKKAFTNFYEKWYIFQCYKKNGGNHFIAISQNSKAYFDEVAGGYPVTMLHNAIEVARFRNVNGTLAKGNVLKLVNTGSLIDIKNQAFLLDVADCLRSKSVNFELHLLGDGINRASLEATIEHNGLEKNVVLHGKVDKVEEYLWKSHIYVHSALLEGLGLVLIEAMAAGLPVVTLDAKGNKDLIEEGKNGYMIYQQNAEAFANAILYIWNDGGRYTDMSRYAASYAAGFDIGRYIDRLVALYKS
jgi:glycosyltransferase involved in cell wall biosynthesis